MASLSLQLNPAFIGLLIIIATWYGNIFIQECIMRLSSSKKIEKTFIKGIQHIANIIIYMLGGLLFLENMNIQIASLLSALGVITVGIGIALQKIIMNMACGIFLLIYKPFCIGDYIISKHFQGKVIDINLRITTLQHQENIVIIPNHTVYNAIITIQKV